MLDPAHKVVGVALRIRECVERLRRLRAERARIEAGFVGEIRESVEPDEEDG